jgi:hypothetical protein
MPLRSLPDWQNFIAGFSGRMAENAQEKPV